MADDRGADAWADLPGLTPGDVSRLLEIESATGTQIEFAQRRVMVIAYQTVLDENYVATPTGERVAGSSLVPEVEGQPATRVLAHDGRSGHFAAHRSCWVCRLRYAEGGLTTPYGWAAPTPELSARFLIWEFDEGVELVDPSI